MCLSLLRDVVRRSLLDAAVVALVASVAAAMHHRAVESGAVPPVAMFAVLTVEQDAPQQNVALVLQRLAAMSVLPLEDALLKLVERVQVDALQRPVAHTLTLLLHAVQPAMLVDALQRLAVPVLPGAPQVIHL